MLTLAEDQYSSLELFPIKLYPPCLKAIQHSSIGAPQVRSHVPTCDHLCTLPRVYYNKSSDHMFVHIVHSLDKLSDGND